MFFYLKTHYQIGQAYLFDINPDLILSVTKYYNSSPPH